MTEVWKKIKGYPGYEVSNQGRVKSYKRVKSGKLNKFWIFKGYNKVILCKNGRSKGFFVHRLVLTAFVRPPKSNEQCSHKNGIRHDNRVENLEWATVTQNHHIKKLHGTYPFGEKSWLSKLTSKQVLKIRAEYIETSRRITNIPLLAKKYKVSDEAIRNIIKRKNWAHL